MHSDNVLWLVCVLVAMPFVFYSVYVFAINRRARISRRNNLRSRAPLSVDDWYDAYFAPLGLSRGNSLAVARCAARAFACEITQFRPSDGWDDVLRFRGINWLGLDSDDETELFVEEQLIEAIGVERAIELIGASHPWHSIGAIIRWCDERHIAVAQ